MKEGEELEGEELEEDVEFEGDEELEEPICQSYIYTSNDPLKI